MRPHQLVVSVLLMTPSPWFTGARSARAADRCATRVRPQDCPMGSSCSALD